MWLLRLREAEGLLDDAGACDCLESDLEDLVGEDLKKLLNIWEERRGEAETALSVSVGSVFGMSSAKDFGTDWEGAAFP